MPKQQDDQEVRAVSAIKAALGPLDEETRERVLTAALALLGMRGIAAAVPTTPSPQPGRGEAPGPTGGAAESPTTPISDIRSLREDKQPKSDVEMAVLVAYYLAEAPPEGSRRDFITAADLNNYFKQAGHKVPQDAGQTLRNAKHAGYLDSRGRAQFALNPVGYNLAVHGLPRSEPSRPSAKRARGPATKEAKGKSGRSTAKRVSSRRK